MGNNPGTARQLGTGERVQIRVQPTGSALLAVSVHVYRQQTPARHVELRGTVTSVSGGALSVRSGSGSYRVSITSQTTVYVANIRSSSSELRSGEVVTVHACCAGSAMVATSVHV